MRPYLVIIGLISTLALVALAGCSSPAFGPEVLVTRVPVAVAAATTDGEQSGESSVISSASPADQQGGNELAAAVATPAGDKVPQAVVDKSVVGAEVASNPTALPQPTPSTNPNLRPLQQTRNILLVGTDQRDLEYVGRTDTIMVLALDLPNQRAALISLPRDIYLPIPGVGYSRINTAYPYGEERRPGSGMAMLESTIEKNFGIPIHNYVRIDFSGFEDVIDVVGGIDITVDCPLYDDNFWRIFGTGTLDKGTYHMDGTQALYYARSRKSTTDFDRARRQQQVLMAIRSRALDAGLIPRIPALWLALKDTIETDLDVRTIADLAKLGATIDRSHLYGLVVRPPLVNSWLTPQGAQVQLPDLPAISEAIDHIWERKPIEQTNNEEKFCPLGQGGQ